MGHVLVPPAAQANEDGAAIGVFSHEVRSALLGGADVDGDDRVTYRELASFVAVANEAVPAGHRPEFFVRAPSAAREAEVFAPGR